MMVKLDPEIYNALKIEGLRAALRNGNQPKCTCARCVTNNVNIRISGNNAVVDTIVKIEKGV